MNIWDKSIYDCIKWFSDLKSQKTMWIGPNHDYVSSFEEDVNLLFDSFAFDDYVIDTNLNKMNLTDHLKKALVNFKIMLESYKEKATDKEILNDPEWHKIVKEAQIVIELWNDEGR